eukprot:gene26323-32889_t
MKLPFGHFASPGTTASTRNLLLEVPLMRSVFILYDMFVDMSREDRYSTEMLSDGDYGTMFLKLLTETCNPADLTFEHPNATTSSDSFLTIPRDLKRAVKRVRGRGYDALVVHEVFSDSFLTYISMFKMAHVQVLLGASTSVYEDSTERGGSVLMGFIKTVDAVASVREFDIAHFVRPYATLEELEEARLQHEISLRWYTCPKGDEFPTTYQTLLRYFEEVKKVVVKWWIENMMVLDEEEL